MGKMATTLQNRIKGKVDSYAGVKIVAIFSQVAETLDPEKLQEYRDIFSFFDRLIHIPRQTGPALVKFVKREACHF